MEELKLIAQVAGPVAGVVLVVVYFLRHLSFEADLNRKTADAHTERMEALEQNSREAVKAVADQFTQAIAENRAESRVTVDRLLAIATDSVKTMAGVSAEVKELGREVREMAKSLDQMRAGKGRGGV